MGAVERITFEGNRWTLKVSRETRTLYYGLSLRSFEKNYNGDDKALLILGGYLNRALGKLPSKYRGSFDFFTLSTRQILFDFIPATICGFRVYTDEAWNLLIKSLAWDTDKSGADVEQLIYFLEGLSEDKVDEVEAPPPFTTYNGSDGSLYIKGETFYYVPRSSTDFGEMIDSYNAGSADMVRNGYDLTGLPPVETLTATQAKTVLVKEKILKTSDKKPADGCIKLTFKNIELLKFVTARLSNMWTVAWRFNILPSVYAEFLDNQRKKAEDAAKKKAQEEAKKSEKPKYDRFYGLMYGTVTEDSPSTAAIYYVSSSKNSLMSIETKFKDLREAPFSSRISIDYLTAKQIGRVFTDSGYTSDSPEGFSCLRILITDEDLRTYVRKQLRYSAARYHSDPMNLVRDLRGFASKQGWDKESKDPGPKVTSWTFKTGDQPKFMSADLAREIMGVGSVNIEIDGMPYTPEKTAQTTQVEGLARLQRQINELERKLSDQSRTHDEQLEALTNRLKTALATLKEKKKEQEEDAENPFKNPLTDGKAQMDMLLRGLIEPRVKVDQVKLPPEIKETIMQTLNQANADIQALLFDEWGFDEILEKGRGIAMLFAGDPGTGKTMMAEALASEMGYLFWNIGSGNLNGMFVGDFEKAVTAAFKKAKKVREERLAWDKAQRVADEINERINERIVAADGVTDDTGAIKASVDKAAIPIVSVEGPEPPKGIILLFDEVDSIVAARDRKSTDGPSWSMGPLQSGQINHFLRELEEFDGIVIFATNRVVALDQAFERRLSLIQEFPFPDAEIRALIWKSKFPPRAPLADDIDWDALAKHEIAGGHIKNAVMHAARMAAREKSAENPNPQITMAHILAGVKKVLEGKQTFNGEEKEEGQKAAQIDFWGGDDDWFQKVFTGSDKPWLN